MEKSIKSIRLDDKPKKIYAFFDVDETIVKFKTMFSFQEYYYLNFAKYSKLFGRLYSYIFYKKYNRHIKQGKPREFINRFYYETFKGRSEESIKLAAKQWFFDVKDRLGNIYITKTLEIIKKHQHEKVEIVLVSGSMPAILSPIASELGITKMLCTQMDVKNGKYTGRIFSPQTIGKGKAQAILDFLKKEGGCRERSFAYGDHISDVPMLETVGNPTIVSNHENMVALAKQKSWRCIDPTE